jgi:hypothetical protein
VNCLIGLTLLWRTLSESLCTEVPGTVPKKRLVLIRTVFSRQSITLLKAEFIKKFYNKPVISIELQAEPWTSLPLAESSLAVQALSMNPELV